MGAAVAALLDTDLCALFEQQKKTAPRRGDCKSYFGKHEGQTTSGKATNRREEHLAIALWNAYRDSGFVLPDGTRLFLQDYQLPLKSHRDSPNAGIGKADLFGVSESGQSWVIELKVHSADGTRAESPLKALLEALAYDAILDANLDALCAQSRRAVVRKRPNLMVLAPSEYWSICEENERRFPARDRLGALRRRIEKSLGVQTMFVSIENCMWTAPASGCGPLLSSEPRFRWAPGQDDYYLDAVFRRLWMYQEKRFTDFGRLFDEQYRERLPVFRSQFADLNIAAPRGCHHAVVASIVLAKRQTWFRSMRSSQALAQSVFGSLKATQKLTLLAGLLTDEGEQAFFECAPPPDRCHLEYPCSTLGELKNRETQSDVYFDCASGPVSVECKFTETGFGACSQPDIEPSKPNFARDHCDGRYSVQSGRKERCSLAEKGILYWREIPASFRWRNDVDHDPCPIREPYQLARNVLASQGGHALLVYDELNPCFGPEGKAFQMWVQLRESLIDPTRLRRCSWQRILNAIEADSDLEEFVRELQEKYGF